MSSAETEVEFRPSLGFLALGIFSPAVLIILGLWGVVRAGELRIVPLVLLVIGLLMALVTALDIPVSIVVDAKGVHRRCAARTQTFPWDEVVAFRRPRGRRGRRGVGSTSAPSGGSAASGAMGNPETGRGGLVLETTARRQYLLSTGRERPDTYVALERAVAHHAPGLSMPGPPYYPRSESSL